MDAAGDIQDGETVLVDYSFTTTGTFKFSIFNQNYEAGVNLFSYFTLFSRFRKKTQRLLSGSSTQPLKSVRSQLFHNIQDLRFDFPPGQQFRNGFDHKGVAAKRFDFQADAFEFG